MGFFSWNCKGCGESIKSPYSCQHKRWQSAAVLLGPNGSRVIGEYDGYGRIGSAEIDTDWPEPEMWHKRCWEAAGKPEFTGSSTYAQDQGYFYDCPECNAFAAAHPWLFDENGQKIMCGRWREGGNGEWRCEEENCPHGKPIDEDKWVRHCTHPDQTSEAPLNDQTAPLPEVVG